MFGGDDAHIDAHHAVFQCLADPVNAANVTAVKVAGQAKFGVVGGINGLLLGLELEHRRKRAEGFFFGKPADNRYYEQDLEFVDNAKAEVFLGLKVFYNSSW